MAQKIVKSYAVTLPSGTFEIVGGAVPGGAEVDNIEAQTLGDTQAANIPHPIKKLQAIALQLADSGTGAPSVGSENCGNCTFTIVYKDGCGSDTSKTTTVSGYLRSAQANTIDVGGDRRSVWDCEFIPLGAASTTTTSN